MRAVIVVMALVMLGISGVAAAQSSSSQDEQILKQDAPSGGTEAAPPAVDEEELSSTYSSIGVQKLSPKVSGIDVTDPILLDITLIGFRIPTVPWFAVELNLGTTVIPGEAKSSSAGSSGNCVPILGCSGGFSGSNSSGDLGFNTAGVFAVLRSTGNVFAMGKVGYRYIGSNIEGYPENRTGTAYGAGVGYRWNKKGSYAELAYTKYTSEISGIGFSISYSYDRRR